MAQTAQAEDAVAPVLGEALPEAHAMQKVAPDAGWCCPLAQGEQLALLVVAADRPGTQAVHASLPELL